MNHRHPLSLSSRLTALEAGLWQTSNGNFVAVVAMHDSHLVNALLKSLRERQPKRLTAPLATEIRRRGIASLATRMAAEQEESSRKQGA